MARNPTHTDEFWRQALGDHNYEIAKEREAESAEREARSADYDRREAELDRLFDRLTVRAIRAGLRYARKLQGITHSRLHPSFIDWDNVDPGDMMSTIMESVNFDSDSMVAMDAMVAAAYALMTADRPPERGSNICEMMGMIAAYVQQQRDAASAEWVARKYGREASEGLLVALDSRTRTLSKAHYKRITKEILDDAKSVDQKP